MMDAVKTVWTTVNAEENNAHWYTQLAASILDGSILSCVLTNHNPIVSPKTSINTADARHKVKDVVNIIFNRGKSFFPNPMVKKREVHPDSKELT